MTKWQKMLTKQNVTQYFQHLRVYGGGGGGSEANAFWHFLKLTLLVPATVYRIEKSFFLLSLGYY